MALQYENVSDGFSVMYLRVKLNSHLSQMISNYLCKYKLWLSCCKVVLPGGMVWYDFDCLDSRPLSNNSLSTIRTKRSLLAFKGSCSLLYGVQVQHTPIFLRASQRTDHLHGRKKILIYSIYFKEKIGVVK